nr:helix-turn-helix domain-containing protein [Pelagimonas varians]
MEIIAISQLSALANDRRLAVFRLLMRRYPDAVSAGDIAQILDLPASSLSACLTHLRRANLVSQSREGTSLLYSAQTTAASQLIDYLSADCCRGRPEQCLASATLGDGAMPRKFSVLFICTGNSIRSIFAETLLRNEAGDRFEVFSAGTSPQSDLNPIAVDLLQAKGYDISGLRAKNIDEFRGANAPDFDFVLTVCDGAANEECPSWSGQPVSGHWGQPDPAKATGTEAEKHLAFQQVFGALQNRIRAFAALPFETLDRASLQNRIDDIAKTKD